MKVDLEGLAEELDQLSEKDHLGPVEKGCVAIAADAVRELLKLEKEKAGNAAALREALETIPKTMTA